MIRLEHVSVRAGDFQLQNISFEVPGGCYGVLLGKTGSGKTTILEAICGLRAVISGSIFLLDRNVTRLKPAERGVGYVPQDQALFQTMTVYEHLSFALVIRKRPRAIIEQRVEELAVLLGIKHLLHRKPQGLSGGELQRVALGRAIANETKILCLDEPLSALDEETRWEMYELLQRVRQKTGAAILHVTHQTDEAGKIADIIFELKEGQIRTAG